MVSASSISDIYVHLPFCAHKCDYCAFLSIEGADRSLRGRFLDRLESELDMLSSRCGPLATIYLGGGTPTHFAPGELLRLMTMIRRYFSLQDDCEFTCEGNPLSLTRDKIEILLDGGVNRISIGVQSFSEDTRQAIGRGGDVNRVYEVFDDLRQCKVRSINCDLIFAAPGQTVESATADVRRLSDLGPDHVSAYSLIVEPGTPLADRGVCERDDDGLVAMWEAADSILAENCGMHRYEVSNHARPGHECRHNCRIWKGHRFLGAGPSACWFDEAGRWQNPPDLNAWFDGDAPQLDSLSPPARAAEILATGLRTTAGWQRSEYRECTGYDFFELRRLQIEALIADGLLEHDEDHLRPTRRGLLFANHIGRELL